VSESKQQALAAPEPLGPEHEVDAFDSGVPALDIWLQKRARSNETEGASRTYVLCAGRRVVGYYALAAGSVLLGQATGAVRRNMPDPVPVALLGRLAILDRHFVGSMCAPLVVDEKSARDLEEPRSEGALPVEAVARPMHAKK